jgi:hypothetical protein
VSKKKNEPRRKRQHGHQVRRLHGWRKIPSSYPNTHAFQINLWRKLYAMRQEAAYQT